MITGKTLIGLGYTPAPWFKQALFKLNVTRDVKTEDMIRQVCDRLYVPIQIVEPFERHQPYATFLFPENQDERDNLIAVHRTMQEVMKTPYALHGDVMPDACPAGPIGTIPVGGVVAMENVIVPGMHSSDVCCSLMATNLGPDVDMKALMDAAFKTTQFGPGKRRGHGGWGNLVYDNSALYKSIVGNYFTQDYIEKAASHMGTQGDGNHFLFIGKSDKTNDVYLITHHGSRGFGASVFKKGFAEAEKIRRKISPNTHRQNAWLPYSEEVGQQYWEALQIVREWTELNHSAIHHNIMDEMMIWYQESFWNEHNFVFKSETSNSTVFHHAKGATPIGKHIKAGTPGNDKRIIPLNMAEPILIVKPAYESISGFCPHGAGRNMGRTEFERRGNTVEKLQKEIAHLDVRFYSGIPDASEFPSAYKNAEQVKRVLTQHRMCEIVEEIIPYGSIMAGKQPKVWTK